MSIEDDIRREFVDAFYDTSVERLGTCRQSLDAARAGAVDARAEILRELHAYKGEARMMGIHDVADAAEAAEAFLVARASVLADSDVALLARAFGAVERLVGHYAGRTAVRSETEVRAVTGLLARAAAAPDPVLSTSASNEVANGTSDAGPPIEGRRDTPVLLIDDSEIVRAMAAQALQAAGYPVHTAATLAEARAAVAACRPSVVLCDLHLGDGESCEAVCRAFRESPALSSIPLYLFSAASTPELAAAAQRFRADGYVAKPGDLDGWVAGLDALLARLTEARGYTERLGS